MRVVAVLFSALAVVACLAPSHLFVTSLKGGLVADDLAVTLEDRTGLVQAFGPAQPGQFNLFDGVKADANPSVLVVSWLGGICDRSTHLVFAGAGGAYSVTRDDGAGSCLPGRGRPAHRLDRPDVADRRRRPSRSGVCRTFP